jgi:hypothetical protein
LALAFGYTSGDWRVANGALKIMQPQSGDLAAQINDLAVRELDLASVGDETADYLASVLDLNDRRG